MPTFNVCRNPLRLYHEIQIIIFGEMSSSSGANYSILILSISLQIWRIIIIKSNLLSIDQMVATLSNDD